MLMKALIALCFCGLSIALSAQTTLRTFTSRDGAFQFKYSSTLIRCEILRAEKGEGNSWVPADACLSQVGICDDDDSPAVTTVCLAYPKYELKGKPEFDSAAFFLAQVAATTPKACFEAAPDWLVRNTENTVVGSVHARHFHTSDAGLGRNQEGDIYRVFHGKTCYELGIEVSTTDPGAFDPGTFNQFTKRDKAEVRARLKQALDSFRFSK
jgi:hypothetical protein